MCGRFTNRFSWKELHERLDLIGTPLNLRPRYNVAPSQDVAVARAAPDGRALAMLRWGLTETMRDLARWLYRQLRAEYEHLTSDEAIDETLAANAWSFTAAGEYFV